MLTHGYHRIKRKQEKKITCVVVHLKREYDTSDELAKVKVIIKPVTFQYRHQNTHVSSMTAEWKAFDTNEYKTPFQQPQVSEAKLTNWQRLTRT
jgi:hypothetical protein